LALAELETIMGEGYLVQIPYLALLPQMVAAVVVITVQL
jgi:hypothetical protein